MDRTSRVRLDVRVTPGQLRLLDTMATKLDQNRAELVREAIAIHLNDLYRRFGGADEADKSEED